MQNNQDVLLRVEHLCQYFPSGGKDFKAVDDISFDIKKGEVFGLVGESGCGKTTTGRSIIKLYKITSGDIYFKGIRISAGLRKYKDAMKAIKKDLKEKLQNAPPNEAATLKEKAHKELAELREKIQLAHYDQEKCDKEYSSKQLKILEDKYQPLLKMATGDELTILRKEYNNAVRKAKKTKLITQIQMIFQDPIASLDPRMTVKEIIAEGLRIQGERDEKIIEEKVYAMLEMVGLVREHASRYPHEFSGGQRQRIGVARAIIMQPELIIADEPVSALDVSVQAQVINLLNELRERLGLTILFIAHDLSVVKYFSDRIGVMYYGKMVELASSDELFAHPLHPYTRSLLSA
ncbi:MAG: ABC transporter ATP-binding protein, partial [Clostridiales bacterium]|nr:ABC transporter ATP-binding protein [Clostridiales bacterium]